MKKMVDKTKCPFCEMGQAKRELIRRLATDLSRKELKELIKIRKKKLEDDGK